MLDIRKASFSYSGNGNHVFENISFSLQKGDIFCLLGPNGCGKTTLLKCIGSILKPQKGNIFLQDQNVMTMSKKELAQKIAYIPQMHEPVFPFSVLDVVLMGRAPHLGLLSSPSPKDVAIAEDSMDTLGIRHLANKSYTEISGGERQLVLFAQTLTQQSSILLLDEPTSQLDFGNQIRILDIVESLAEKGLCIVMTTHFPDHAFRVANKTAIMHDGKFLDMGHPNHVITPESLLTAYGADVKIVSLDNHLQNKICVPLRKGPEVPQSTF